VGLANNRLYGDFNNTPMVLEPKVSGKSSRNKFVIRILLNSVSESVLKMWNVFNLIIYQRHLYLVLF